MLELDVAMLGATRELNSEGELSGDSTVVGLSCFEVGEPNIPPLPRRFVKLGSLVSLLPRLVHIVILHQIVLPIFPRCRSYLVSATEPDCCRNSVACKVRPQDHQSVTSQSTHQTGLVATTHAANLYIVRNATRHQILQILASADWPSVSIKYSKIKSWNLSETTPTFASASEV